MGYKIFQNKEKGTTVAIYDNTCLDAINYIEKRTKNIGYIRNGMPDQIVAKVRCHEDDKFNEDEGKKQAFIKADKKHNKYLKRSVIDYQKQLIKEGIAINKGWFDEALRSFGYERKEGI